MVDEQLYYQQANLNSLERAYDMYKYDDKKFKEMFLEMIYDMSTLSEINDIEKEKALQLLK